MENGRLIRTIIALEFAAGSLAGCVTPRSSNAAESANPAINPTPITEYLPEGAPTAAVMATVLPKPTMRAPIPTETRQLVPTATSEPLPYQEIPMNTPIQMSFSTAEGGVEVAIMPMEYNSLSLQKFSNHEDGIALVNPRDIYGNMIIQIHSGFAQEGDNWRQLPAEGLREFIEGGKYSGSLAQYDEDEQRRRIASLLGGMVQVEIDGQMTTWKIVAGQKVSHQDIPDFHEDTKLYAQKLIAYAARDGEMTFFDSFSANPGMILIISSRARAEDNARGGDKWSYGAYAFGLQEVK